MEIGLDFSLRYALGVSAREDIDYGRGEKENEVTVEEGTPRKPGITRRFSDWLLEVRTEICRVRMAVHPDLENRICRISGNTMELIGIEEGDKVIIESVDGTVEGIKALRIDSESEGRKEQQKESDPDRYVDCYEKLDLGRIRETGIDIPEIYLDAEIRNELRLGEKFKRGVCQPVTVYRDTRDLSLRLLPVFLAPLVFAFVSGSGILLFDLWISMLLVVAGVFMAVIALIVHGRNSL